MCDCEDNGEYPEDNTRCHDDIDRNNGKKKLYVI